MAIADNHKLHSLQVPRLITLHSVSLRPHSLQQGAVHPLPLLCSPALSVGLRACRWLDLFSKFSLCTIRRFTRRSVSGGGPLFGAAASANPTTHSAAFLIARIALLRAGFLAHTLPPARGLTPEASVRPRRLAKPLSLQQQC